MDPQVHEDHEETEDNPGGRRVAPQRGHEETEGTHIQTGSSAAVTSLSIICISEVDTILINIQCAQQLTEIICDVPNHHWRDGVT